MLVAVRKIEDFAKKRSLCIWRVEVAGIHRWFGTASVISITLQLIQYSDSTDIFLETDGNSVREITAADGLDVTGNELDCSG